MRKQSRAETNRPANDYGSEEVIWKDVQIVTAEKPCPL
jgi:hypothetical protein